MDKHRKEQRQKPPLMSNEDVEAIIVQGDTRMLVTQAEKLGRNFKDAGLTTSQIRNIFGTVRQIEMLWPLDAQKDDEETQTAMRELLLLKPRLAYQARRTRQVEGLRDVLILAIDAVGYNRLHFQRFADFFEAILAYHIAAGGK